MSQTNFEKFDLNKKFSKKDKEARVDELLLGLGVLPLPSKDTVETKLKPIEFANTVQTGPKVSLKDYMTSVFEKHLPLELFQDEIQKEFLCLLLGRIYENNRELFQGNVKAGKFVQIHFFFWTLPKTDFSKVTQT